MKKLLKKEGFTLVELIVVIAIIAIMLAMVIPNLSIAAEKEREYKEKARSFYSNVQELIIDEKLAKTPLDDTYTLVYVELLKQSSTTACEAKIYMSSSGDISNFTAADATSNMIGDFKGLDSSDINYSNANGKFNEFAYSLYKILRLSDLDNDVYCYALIDDKYRVDSTYYSMYPIGDIIGQQFKADARVTNNQYLTGAYPYDRCSQWRHVFGQVSVSP